MSCYEAGQEAFQSGKTQFQCPYENQQQKSEWLNGWHDEKRANARRRARGQIAAVAAISKGSGP